MCYIDKICKLFLLLVLFSFDLSAQTVTTVDGYPVINLSDLNPLGAVLSSAEASERRTQMQQNSPSNTVGYVPAGYNGTWNAKMSIKYQVMRTNLGINTDWSSAYNACKSYKGEGGSAGQWRLPTQRELAMIWILHPQLILIGREVFIPFVHNSYWSISEYTSDYALNMNFNDGSLGYGSKALRLYVRCVRDL